MPAFEPRCQPPHRLVLPVPVDPSGATGPTKGQAAGPRWRRVASNLYVPASTDRSVPEQRIAEEAGRLRGQGAVTGWAALRLARATYFDGLARGGRHERPVPLAFLDGRGRRRTTGSEPSYERLDRSAIIVLQGVPVTRPLRSLFFEMRQLDDWREAVVAMDMAAAAELVSIAMMARHLDEHSGWRGSPQVRTALLFASELSRSPTETRLRLLWVVDAGLPPPFVNRAVFDLDGNLVCVADLFDEEAGMVVEYDGADHLTMRRRRRDVVRQEASRRLGLEYCTVTGPDMHHPALVLERLLSVRSRARFAAPAARGWTLEPPSRWQPRESLDERLAHRRWLAEQLEQERKGRPAG